MKLTGVDKAIFVLISVTVIYFVLQGIRFAVT